MEAKATSMMKNLNAYSRHLCPLQRLMHPTGPGSEEQRVCGSGDADEAATCPSSLEDAAALLSTFPDIPEPLDADSGQRRVLFDTGQRVHLANSSTMRDISDSQHSAMGAAANQETVNMANY